MEPLEVLLLSLTRRTELVLRTLAILSPPSSSRRPRHRRAGFASARSVGPLEANVDFPLFLAAPVSLTACSWSLAASSQECSHVGGRLGRDDVFAAERFVVVFRSSWSEAAGDQHLTERQPAYGFQPPHGFGRGRRLIDATGCRLSTFEPAGGCGGSRRRCLPSETTRPAARLGAYSPSLVRFPLSDCARKSDSVDVTKRGTCLSRSRASIGHDPAAPESPSRSTWTSNAASLAWLWN